MWQILHGRRWWINKGLGGQIVFCNPPYGSAIKDWVKKCSEESKKDNTTVVMLIPARTDTKYFHDYIYQKENVEVRFLRGRLKFGNSENSAPFPSMVVVFRWITPNNTFMHVSRFKWARKSTRKRWIVSRKHIMSCGHIANDLTQIGEPFCSKCLCFDAYKEIEGETILYCSHWGCPEINMYGHCAHLICTNPKYNGDNQYRFPNRPVLKEKYHCADCSNGSECEQCTRTEHIKSPFAW